jgi:hypothetical protein
VGNPVIWQWGLSILVPAVAGFVGVLTGAWLSSRREREQRQYAFVQQQLEKLYSPLLGLRAEIRLRSELRNHIQGVAGSEWQRLCAEVRNTSDPIGGFERLQDERWKDFEASIEYNNKQLTEELIPAYRRMLTIFRDNMWLAEPQTRAFFNKLLEYIEIWERWLARSIPYEVVQSLGHSEEPLHPFYEHLELQHDLLRKRLRDG